MACTIAQVAWLAIASEVLRRACVGWLVSYRKSQRITLGTMLSRVRLVGVPVLRQLCLQETVVQFVCRAVLSYKLEDGPGLVDPGEEGGLQ